MSATKNITWKGALNKHLVNILSKEYSKFVTPPHGQSKKSICAGWARVLGVDDKDPTGEKVKQNVDKIINLWKRANKKRNSAGFSDLVKDDGTTVTTQDQLLAICDVFFELDPFMSNRRTITPTGGLQATSPNADPNIGSTTLDHDDLDSPEPFAFDSDESLDSAGSAAESAPETPVARKKRLSTTKRSYQQREESPSDYDPGSDVDEIETASATRTNPKKRKQDETPEPEEPSNTTEHWDAKNVVDMLAAASEVSRINAQTAQLRAEAKILQLGGIPSTQHEHLRSEGGKDREVELKRLEVQAEELRVRERLQREELLYKREELAVRKLEAEARIVTCASGNCGSSSQS